MQHIAIIEEDAPHRLAHDSERALWNKLFFDLDASLQPDLYSAYYWIPTKSAEFLTSAHGTSSRDTRDETSTTFLLSRCVLTQIK